MEKFFTANPDGSYSVKGIEYGLKIFGHRISVLIENTEYACLDVRCSMPKTLDDNSGFQPENESEIPTLVAVNEGKGEVTFVWSGKSDLWVKKYTLTCNYLRFKFEVTVTGNGRVDSVNYFSGNMQEARHGSIYEFYEGYHPAKEWDSSKSHYFVTSKPCHRFAVYTVPPMFCFAFKVKGFTKQLGLGLVAKRGEHNFHHFDYNVDSDAFHSGGFYLSTDQYGHAVVDGEWTAPAIIGYSGMDEWDVLTKYCNYYYSSGIAIPHTDAKKPRFWYGPLACGWIEQMIRADGVIEKMNEATQPVYEEIMEKMKRFGLKPSAIVIDDKWQKEYAIDIVDTDKWSDIRGFVDKQLNEDGIRTMLWFKLWDPEGLCDEACIRNDRGNKFIDPTHPEFLKLLDAAIERTLSDAPGCYNCAGYKLDYAMDNPVGRNVKSYNGKYGVELLYEYISHIYKKAKSVKSDALINCSPCHPYFADVCDQARLHDYDGLCRMNREELTARAKVFSIVFPGVLLDTDNAGFNTYRDTMNWLINQNTVGVPSIYSLLTSDTCNLTDEDFEAVAAMWDEYIAIIDKKVKVD